MVSDAPVTAAAERSYQRRTTPVAGGSYCVHEWRAARPHPDEGRVPLVLLHGFTGTGKAWEGPARALRQADYVLAPDLPGHGATELELSEADFGFDAACTALVRVLDDREIETCAVHGYSLGGRLALYFALERPERVAALSLESASPGLASTAERSARRHADAELACFAKERGIEAFVDRWERTPVLASQRRIPATERARLRELRLGNRAEGLAASLRAMGAGAQPYLGDRLGEIAVPVLVMAGSDDEKFAAIAEKMATGTPTATLHMIAGAGHSPHLERTEAWAQAVDAWLERAAS